MGAGKELWLEAHECALEDLMDIEGIDRERATRELDGILDREPKYLDDYLFSFSDF